jgi:hypothetical protein
MKGPGVPQVEQHGKLCWYYTCLWLWAYNLSPMLFLHALISTLRQLLNSQFRIAQSRSKFEAQCIMSIPFLILSPICFYHEEPFKQLFKLSSSLD